MITLVKTNSVWISWCRFVRLTGKTVKKTQKSLRNQKASALNSNMTNLRHDISHDIRFVKV
jgi:hypothetical protein